MFYPLAVLPSISVYLYVGWPVAQDLLEIDRFTVVCPVNWPLNAIEAGVDLVSIQTSLLLFCNCGGGGGGGALDPCLGIGVLPRV